MYSINAGQIRKELKNYSIILSCPCPNFIFDLYKDLEQSIKNTYWGSSRCGAAETSPTRNHEVVGLIPGLDHWVKVPALP